MGTIFPNKADEELLENFSSGTMRSAAGVSVLDKKQPDKPSASRYSEAPGQKFVSTCLRLSLTAPQTTFFPMGPPRKYHGMAHTT